ncbi:hypothetical protein BJ170DRAFT_684729 [Xylariales sp. AK1849]|nr:hypothetical protein BJ170DRAFT_684729 [Xylariales sp. AK1849]
MATAFSRLAIPQAPRAVTSTPLFTKSPAPTPSPVVHFRHFTASTTSPAKAQSSKGGSGKKRRKGKGEEPDPRIRNLKVSIPRKVPAPLRFARNRALRHWTIHRAWQLYQRKEREREERELMRMYQSMSNACEELRNTSGPGTRDEGYLYRVAMEKKGLFGHKGIPIEYARPQTETPARIVWNHDWTR